MNKTFEYIKQWLIADKIEDFDENIQGYCRFRDLFNVRADRFLIEVKKPILAAVAGEIGSNSFDHNFAKWKDIVGIIFKYDINQRVIVIADRGQGLKTTLSNVRVGIENDIDAVKIAFKEVLSGRAPERRGNGLKFVFNTIITNNWKLYFQSGNGVLEISEGKAIFSENQENIKGCLAIINY
ncbi:MAG: hypothetical protein LBT79_03985 [Elusimicrobiota bacterium]|jgi:hypothetical protein|nr:hypothetical protein [Elusimicrobiota bacterium]